MKRVLFNKNNTFLEPDFYDLRWQVKKSEILEMMFIDISNHFTRWITFVKRRFTDFYVVNMAQVE